MASGVGKNLGFYIKKLFKIKEGLNGVNSINKLIKIRDRYLIWYGEIRQFFDKRVEYKSISIYLPDKVQQSFFREGGVGFIWGDKRSQLVLGQIQEEINDKMAILEKITPYSQWNKIIQKIGNTFYCLGKPISIGEKSIHYHLLDILCNRSDQDGFLSYQKIILEMKKRSEKGLLNHETKSITQRTISNAKDNLFNYSRINDDRWINKTPNGKEIIEVIWGKGLKLNNEEV